MNKSLETLAGRIIAGEQLSVEESIALSASSGTDAFALFLAASRVKEHFLGNGVDLCSIINAKSGRCPENCAFCAQSAHHTTNAPIYPLVDEDKLVACAKEAEAAGSRCYGIITSGTTIKKGEELDRICRAVRRIRETTSIAPSCSLGIIDHETAVTLREAGVETYHHNLETSRSFFPHICTTHDYEEDVETVRVAKQAGLTICCGGIFGLGETAAQRVELAMTLRELDVDSVPLNFLNPIEGTRLAGSKLISPLECLKTIALFRLILPTKKIAVCGGREQNLRDLQSWIFFAGASGTMIGNYLTTTGRPAEQDWQMLRDLELAVGGCCE
ncbi:biotin synthase [Geobacter metallireducens RCH3]|uniref:Biotin synthase n=1 Tax=Geobacter metallireducens (strain ATCC 53774 / DSM 7210 / GS-15) TaxID=269799 RepID=BIOB_GEOMG|nr:biotin synthase BioB [Geobacter metallireducens]Q39VB0.1 RecName: Full=Biotin synthase [Geobacter metallireducens GS-15]ABB31814.1 biotin synthase [Geobacter metallireducens GS-15]EHP89304.1 biotin synthase [Geobacter metallireducens RCH3]